MQQDIVSELRTPDKLRESLDVVEIVLGLLSSGGGNPKFSLKQFIDSRRMGRKPFSAKVRDAATRLTLMRCNLPVHGVGL